MAYPQAGRQRVVLERLEPQVDAGRFPIKRAVGDSVDVAVNAFTDGHDRVKCALRFRGPEDADWREAPMTPAKGDRWSGRFTPECVGVYSYSVIGWIDHFETWRHDLARRTDMADIAIALEIGAEMVLDSARRSTDTARTRLETLAASLLDADLPVSMRRDIALGEELAALMAIDPPRRHATIHEPQLELVVDPERGRFSAWYEMFPRSCVHAAGNHGRLRDCHERLPRIAQMGFDVLYLPPIHPIGRINRKGRNNSLHAEPGDPGSPWAIGAEEGGHKAIHPALGTLDDFREFVAAAQHHGLQVALDIALQCAPDHPYVAQHPQWFRWRPDDTVQYAENPPKKYQDIYPFDFETDDWQALWEELKSIFSFWIEQGVRIFRVDNPHTKPFEFWEWCIRSIKAEHPDVIFLSEAFARPNVMFRLAKLGFSQSYTYFTWRNTKWELSEYMQELNHPKVHEFFRPNFWPNTPDILPEYLQFGGRPAFAIRLTLAATLSSSYGIYGPAFELAENEAVRPGSEEYLDSEKYQVRHWDSDSPHSLRPYIARLNRVRRENPALQYNLGLRFHPTDNDEILCFSKRDPSGENLVLVVVSLDAYHTQSGWVELPLDELELDALHPYQMHDLVSDARFLWHGHRNFVELDPHAAPAHVFRLRRHVRTENDFEYFF